MVCEGQKICGDAVYKDKVKKKSIARPVLEIEKSVLVQKGVEFQVKMKWNENIKFFKKCAHQKENGTLYVVL